ncbi:hypothetical protein AB3N04_01085 (plasmid) [Alkalihalophilus sp. As8PL]|uniref:PRTRC system protein B n=1 Tax=Alkalihalophilus sp. As8PL TaxID=3237103 RepID=A0AB39BNU1_9BACI
MIKIEIDDENSTNLVSVVHETNGIVINTYQTSLFGVYEGFKNSFQEGSRPKGEVLAIQTGLMAKGALFEVPHFDTDTKRISAITCGFVVSKSMWPCEYFDTKFDAIGMPSALIVLTYDGERVSSPRIFALKTDEVEEDTLLYNWPFPNIHRNGNVCMGHNSLPTIKSKNELVAVTRWLLQLPYINDLYEAAVRNVPKMNPRELFNELVDKEFPDGWLIKATPTKTIKEFMSKL